MKTRRLGKTGLQISEIAFGAFALDKKTREDADSIVGEVLERGVNYFDLAPTYGNAQEVLGGVLPGRRDKFHLACKTVERDAENSRKEFEESLRIMGTDYFDVYQLHAVCQPDEVETVAAPGGALETLRWAKERGYARHVGFTTHSRAAAMKLLTLFPFETMMCAVNYHQWLVLGQGPDEIALAKEHDIGVLGIKALAEQRWGEGMDRSEGYRTWYKPIYDNDEFARLALAFSLSKDFAAYLTPT